MITDRPRLANVVTFKRIKSDAVRDDAGQVDESIATNWEVIGKRRADVRQESSSERYASNQQTFEADWSITCRGDALTRSVSMKDVAEFVDHGQLITLNITGIRTINDVPHYLEFTGKLAKGLQ